MPALSPDRLARRLREGAKGGVFLLTGQEYYLRDTTARSIVDAHLEGGLRDFNLDDVRGGEVTPETLGSLIQTPPMMADWRVVVVRGAEALAVSPTMRTLLETTVSAPPPGLALVLVAEIEGSKAKIWNTLKKAAVHVEFRPLSDADRPGWLMARAGDIGVRIEPEAARALAMAVGPDLGAAVRDLEKLREYVADRGVITRQDVIAVVGVIPRQDRWDWINLVAERRFVKARSTLPVVLDAGDSGVGLVIGLATQFLRIGYCLAAGAAALGDLLPRHQKWLSGQVAAQARGWTDRGVADAIAHLQRADRLLKSAAITDLKVLEEVLLRLEHEQEAAA